jgi:hypothetical protein
MFSLYILSFVLTCVVVHASPIGSLPFLNEDFDDENYDIVVDQRQNGTQNFRFRVNGLSIALPAEESPDEQQQQISEMDLANLLGLAVSTQAPTNANSDKNEFADFASALFDWKKKSVINKKLDDTQSRTKDLPTEAQLAGDTKSAVHNFAKVKGRKYKLMIGERYILPLIQYLKKHSESIV